VVYVFYISSKNFTKVGADRITWIVDKVIRPIDVTFMPGRHILEGVVLYEGIHTT
jgi:hypothetical protein